MEGGSRRHRGGASGGPKSPVNDLLQQLRALGLLHSTKTYAGLAAGRGGAAAAQAGGGYSRGSKERGGASAFFRRHHSGGAADLKAGALLHPQPRRGALATGSATPPVRPAARAASPDAGASPWQDDEDALLFQMSGLKPLRTSSRLARQPGLAEEAGAPRSMHRTKSAPAERAPDVAPGRSPPVHRAFSFAGEPSPRDHAAPRPTVSRTAAGNLPPAAPAEVNTSEEVVVGELSPAPTAAGTHTPRSTPPPGSPEGGEPGAAALGEEAAPGWSEELLTWMLSDKAGLLVDAQRAARRQQELEAEVERLRARGGSADREVQRLSAERRSLLDRVQRLSAAEAEASARAERLAMETDVLAAELQHSQEVCREMLAARRAARDALSEVSAQNARLLSAYVAMKREAAGLKDALRQQQRQGEARIRALEAQLQAAQAMAGQGMAGQLRSPPPSPLAHAYSASPAGSASSVDAHDLLSEGSERSADDVMQGGSGAGTPGNASPGTDKENACLAGNGGGRQARRPAKAQWDEERSELLSLLERLQDQLSVHAEQQASASKCERGPQRRQQGTPRGRAAPPPSPFSQPLGNAGTTEEQLWQPQPPPEVVGEQQTPMPPTASQERQASPAGRRSSGAAGNLSASFDRVSGDSAESTSTAESEEVEGGSPAITSHHPGFSDSPLPLHSATRSGAPSPPSVRQQRPSEEQAPCAADDCADDAPEQLQQRWSARGCSSAGGSQTLEAFLSPPGCSPTPATEPPCSSSSAQDAAKQQRLLQAEQRAAELEAELERLRKVNAAAEARAQREERRREAEAAKASGNAAFQVQSFQEAVRHYSAGLDILEGLHAEEGAAGDAALAAVLHCNRAAAHHACGAFLDALADCFRAAALDPGYARVYHRRADAYWALGAYDAAAQDLAHLAKLGGGPDVAARLADTQRRARAQQPVNHYAVLGLAPAATPGEIKAAYRQLALRYHPDKAAGAAGGLGADAAGAIFKLLAQAHSVLGDAEQRRHHDIVALRHKYRRFYGGQPF